MKGECWRLNAVPGWVLAVCLAPMVTLPAAFYGSTPSPRAEERKPASHPGEPIREIDDPANGNRWLLWQDRNHPEGPGQLVRARPTPGRVVGLAPETKLNLFPIIQTGDSVVVEESTDVSDLLLCGTAIGPAAQGNPFLLRFPFWPGAVRAIAVAPHRALLAGGVRR